MIALRLQHVAIALNDGGAQFLVNYRVAQDTAAARDYLLQLKGVGPAVVESYLLLRSSTAS
jgi:3-methyladenine DNA glycosylase/8-oxoguanine DNA glycosylase